MSRLTSITTLLASFTLTFTVSIQSLANPAEVIQIKKDSVRLFVVAPGATYLVDRVAGICFFQRTFIKEQKSLEQMSLVEVSCDKLKKHSEIERFFNQTKDTKESDE